MFKMVEHRKVWWPVTWDCPVDGGKTQKAQIKMRFILMNTDNAAQLIRQAEALDEEDASALHPSDRKAQLLAQMIDDWEGVGNEEGEKVDFDVDALARFFRLPGTFLPVVESYVRCMNGEPEARRKN